MPPLQVKDCPQDVYEKLRECAQRENRSIAQQTLTILQEYLGMRESSFDATAQTLSSIDTQCPHIDPRTLPTNTPSSYLHEDKGVDYLTRRMETFKRIEALPSLPISPSRPRADVLLAEIREEEAR